MQPHNFSCWNLSGDHFLSCFFPLVAVPEAPPHLAAALGSGRPSGPGLPAQAQWDDSSSAAPMWHLKHHCTCCFCVFPQPPETWKSSRTIFTRALARTSPREGTRECSFNNSRQTNERLFNTLLDLHTAEDLPKSRMFLLVPHDPNSLLISVCVAQLCLPLFNQMDYSRPGSSVHGISQARILGWVAISSSRGSSGPRDRTHVPCTDRWIICH